MLQVGITGGIGSGKTKVCKVFETLGIAVYNADTQAKQLMNTDTELKAALKNYFGNDIYHKDGTVDRPKLAEIIFHDPASLEKTNSCVHPAVIRDFDNWCTMQKSPYVIEESAIIYETNIAHLFGKVIMVAAPENTRVMRVCIRDHVTPEIVQQRMANQWTDKKKITLADYVIYNDSLRLITPQVVEIHKQLLKIA